MAKLRVFNPVAESLRQEVPAAPRLSSLEGKRIGLFWNMKGGGDAALDRTDEILKQRFPGVITERFNGSVGHYMRHLSEADTAQAVASYDAVVGTSGD